MGMPESQKDSEMRKLKSMDLTLHSLVKSIMDDMRQQAKNQGGSQVLAQQFGKQGLAILSGRYGSSPVLENWVAAVRRLPRPGHRIILVDNG
jgi:hypothetical protein